MLKNELEEFKTFICHSKLIIDKNVLLQQKSVNTLTDFLYNGPFKDKINIKNILTAFISQKKFDDNATNELDVILIRQFNEIHDIIEDTIQILHNPSNIILESNTRLLLERFLIFKNLSSVNFDENLFKFLIYKIAGLKNREETIKQSDSDEILLEKQKQKKELDKCYSDLLKTQTFLKITNKHTIIDCKIKKTDFKPTIENDVCIFSTNWQTLLNKHLHTNNLYAYLSYKVHPSYLNYRQYNHKNIETTLLYLTSILAEYYFAFKSYYKLQSTFEYENALLLFKGI